jgi:hypothetical protein
MLDGTTVGRPAYYRQAGALLFANPLLIANLFANPAIALVKQTKKDVPANKQVAQTCVVEGPGGRCARAEQA